ncbi:MAG: hypothetical protein FJY37_13995 [Betaproteobacteria bacterium]|nr:hypothetical protein [Betaproteobacteria bacterium]
MANPSPQSTAQSPLPGPTWVWVSVLILAWALPGLFGHDPWKPDEAAAMGVIWNLLEGGSWVQLELAGESLAAAPLTYWWCGLWAWLLDGLMTPHHGARLGAALMAAAAVASVLRGVHRLAGREAVVPALLFLLGCLGFIPEAHHVAPDMALLLGYGLALNGLAPPRPGDRQGYWLGAGIGVVFLGGGSLHAAVLVASILLLPVLFRPWRHSSWGSTSLQALIAFAPFGVLWPLLLYLESSAALTAWLSWKEHLRALSGPGMAAAVYNHLRLLSWFSAPAWPIALWALWRGRRQLGEDPLIQLGLVMFVSLFVLMLFDRDTGDSHRVVLLLPIVLLATKGLPQVRRGGANGLLWFSVLFFLLFAVAGWLYWMAMDTGFPARLHARLMRMQPGYEVRWLLPRVLAALVMTAGWAWIIYNMRRSPERPILAWIAGATLAWALAFTLFNNYLDAGRSYRSVSYEIASTLPKGHNCVASEGLGPNQRAMLHYFGGLVTERRENPAARRDCTLLLIQSTHARPNDPGKEWNPLFSGARPGDKKELYQLFARRK